MLNCLRNVRTSMHLSQNQIASQLHISRQAYGMYERGERHPPYEFLLAFSDFCRIGLDDLLGHPSPPPVLNQEESDLLTLFRELDRQGRQRILDFLEYEQMLTIAQASDSLKHPI